MRVVMSLHLLLQENLLVCIPELIRALPEPWYSQAAEACPPKCPSWTRRAGPRSEKTEALTRRRVSKDPPGI